MSIAGIKAPPLAQNIKDTKPLSDEQKKTQDAHKVGADFEAILVRQMLSKANLGQGSYGDMAVEAMASAVTKGGGLGLGRVIENQLAPHQAETHASTTAASTASSEAAKAFKKSQAAQTGTVSVSSATPSKI